jgi:hypothetical protein
MGDAQSIDDLIGAIGLAIQPGEVRAYPERALGNFVDALAAWRRTVAAASAENAGEPRAGEGAIRA